MVAWPGEQLPFSDVIVEAGPLDPSSVWDALDVTVPGDTTVTVSAGDQFYLYSDTPRLAVPGDVLGECNWIIDVVDGDAAATVETGFDPDWSYDPPAWQPTGVTTLTGRVVVPLPTGDRSFERLWNEGAALLRITVTAGSATLSGAWLQLEPPDGLKILGGWEWSPWLTPNLVAAKADLGSGNAGASVTIGGETDPHLAVDAVREDGTATGGSSLAPDGTGPYTYTSTGRIDSDPILQAQAATGYDSASAVLMDPPSVYAKFNVGYSSGYWRERPTLRQLPAGFGSLKRGRDWLPIAPGSSLESMVEFDPDGHTVGVRWDDIYLQVTTLPDGNEIAGNVGYSPGILLPPAPDWSGTFAAWPPPLGARVLTLTPPSAPFPDPRLPVTPPPGSDWTITAYTDMAVSAYPSSDEWQQWNVRPHGTAGTAIYIWHQMPDYRYHVPVFVPSPDAVGLKPRFFVKHRDDTMRPVGFGKPATELTVFRVPGRGRWRDLTADEYATFGPDNRPPGGMPLKVKRLDGSGAIWWDHVGWMVPDA